MHVGIIRDEHKIQTQANAGFHVLAVIRNPADSAIFTHNPVFHIILVIFVLSDLLRYRCGNHFIIRRMYHPPECEAGICFELIQTFAAENIANCLIGIQQSFTFVRSVDKETARYMITNLSKHGKNPLDWQHLIRLADGENRYSYSDITCFRIHIDPAGKRMYN